MNKNLVQQITATQIRHDIPDFVTGDTVRVMVTIREGNKERQQAFEGVVISIRGTGVSKTFVVRKDSAGIGVERNFFVNSPVLASITVLKHGKVRRKKIFYLRDRRGKAAVWKRSSARTRSPPTWPRPRPTPTRRRPPTGRRPRPPRKPRLPSRLLLPKASKGLAPNRFVSFQSM